MPVGDEHVSGRNQGGINDCDAYHEWPGHSTDGQQARN